MKEQETAALLSFTLTRPARSTGVVTKAAMIKKTKKNYIALPLPCMVTYACPVWLSTLVQAMDSWEMTGIAICSIMSIETRTGGTVVVIHPQHFIRNRGIKSHYVRRYTAALHAGKSLIIDRSVCP